MITQQVKTETLKRVTIKSAKGKRLLQFYSSKVRKDSVLITTGVDYYQLALQYAINPRLITNKLPAEEKNPFKDYGFNPWKELSPGNQLFQVDDYGMPVLTEVIDKKYTNYINFMRTTGFALIPFFNITDRVLEIIDEEIKSASDPFIGSLKFRFYNEHYLIQYENR